MSASLTERVGPLPVEGQPKESWLLLGSYYAVVIAGAAPPAVVELKATYVLLAAFLCGAHALLVGPGGGPLLGDSVCRMLSVGALLWALIESVALHVNVSYGLAHFLVLVQVVLIYGPHRTRDLRLLPVVALFELMVAGIWALDIVYLPAFLLSATTIMANLLAVDMHSDPGARPNAPAPPFAEVPVSKRDFLAAAWLPALVVLLATAALFPLLPRFGGLPTMRHVPRPPLLIGFSENVSLQEIGRLHPSNRLAMRVQFVEADAAGQPPVQPPQVLMRGASLPLYRSGQWLGYASAMAPMVFERPTAPAEGPPLVASQSIYELRDVAVPRRLILQKVELDQPARGTLFSLYRPLQDAPQTSRGMLRGSISDNLTHQVGREIQFSYEVLAMVPQFTAQMLREAGTPRPTFPWLAFWDVPDKLGPVLDQVHQQVEDAYHPKTDYDRVMACVQYLKDPARFTYTIDLPDYGDEDPVGAFLTTTHRGSCEQFSSALALMLRTWSIPTRLVVGYKDGFYDPVRQIYEFRDRDAHAWVEVYFSKLGWVQFDPTPGSSGGPAQLGPAATSLLERLQSAASTLFAYADMHWTINVLGFGRDQQKALVRGVSSAGRGLVDDATDMLRAIWPGLPNLGFMEVALIVVGITFVGIGLYLGGGWLDRSLRRRRRELPARTVRFYQDLLAILRRKGLRRAAHQTPGEFAPVAAAYLAPGNGDVERAIGVVTDLYYRARFGGYELDAAETARASDALRALKDIPRPRSQAGKP
jgi:transglutaminase-like putative cysteine protease